MIKNRDVLWFRGLKYAEEIGVKDAVHQLNIHEFFDDGAFKSGVVDYINYYENTLKKEIFNHGD